jgi:Protein of unknown function (DUF1552)
MALGTTGGAMTQDRRPSRRDVLRGSGALLALPWFESLAWRTARAEGAPSQAPPVRLCVLYQPNGVNAEQWAVKGEGAAFEWSPTLAPLSDLREHVTVISGLWHPAAAGGDGHYVKTGAFLTGTTIRRTTGRDLDAGNLSADQLVAQTVGRDDLLPSLELSAQPISGGIDTNVNYTRLYGSYLSWSTRTTPCAREIEPRRAFDRVFRPGSMTTPAESAKSTLDRVRADADRLRRELSAGDRAKLDEYLESIRAVEKRIASEEEGRRLLAALPANKTRAIDALDERIRATAEDPALASHHGERVKLLGEIAALALVSRVTRVVTFMFGNAVTNQNFSFVDGVAGGFHEYSHHEGKPEKLEPYARINRWHVERFADVLRTLNAFPEANGTVLDNSLVLFGAGFRDGNAHDPRDLPLVVGGRGGGGVRAGRHLAAKLDTPMSNLLLALVRRCGVAAEGFADATEELDLR